MESECQQSAVEEGLLEGEIKSPGTLKKKVCSVMNKQTIFFLTASPLGESAETEGRLDHPGMPAVGNRVTEGDVSFIF